MNIERIFKALEKDNQNSALGIITDELEKQEYHILINDEEISARDFFEGRYTEFENRTKEFLFDIENEHESQGFVIEFIDFHTICIKKAPLD